MYPLMFPNNKDFKEKTLIEYTNDTIITKIDLRKNYYALENNKWIIEIDIAMIENIDVVKEVLNEVKSI